MYSQIQRILKNGVNLREELFIKEKDCLIIEIKCLFGEFLFEID